MNNQNHFDSVTGLRAIAALFVMLSHVWYQVWPAVPAPFGYGIEPEGLTAWVTGWLYYGHFGVVVFIVVSGFCLMLPVARHDLQFKHGIGGFYRRRCRRILPPYYVSMSFSLLLIFSLLSEPDGSQWDIALPITCEGVIAHILMLHDLIAPTQINYVYWSIALEFQLYLLFPLLIWIWRKRGGNFTLVSIGGLVYGVMFFLELAGSDIIPPQFLGLIVFFVLGMYTATLVVNTQASRPQLMAPLLLVVSLAAVVALCVYWGHARAEENFSLLDSLVALATSSLIVLSCRHRGYGKQLSSPQLLRVGAFSYSLYLVHAPIIAVLDKYVVRQITSDAEMRFVLLLAIATPVCLGLAHRFYLWFERPFIFQQRTSTVMKKLATVAKEG